MNWRFLIGKPVEFCKGYLDNKNVKYEIFVYNGKKMGITDSQLVINYVENSDKLTLIVSDFLMNIK